MKQVILFLLFFIQVAVFGQKQVKNANKAFQKESYIAASKIYEDAVNKGDVTPELLRNLGDSYYYNARYAEAAPWYAKLFQLSSEQTAEYYYRYAQALKSAQQADRSDSVMAVFCSKFPTEIRAKNYLVKQRYFFENNPFLAIRLKNLEINTAYSDYGATIHGDSIYFASARPEILDPEEYERTQQPYTNLFVAKFIDTTASRSKIYDNGKVFSVFHESTPTFSSDGKTMYYTKNELVSKKNKTLVNGRYRIYKSIYENGKWIDKGVVNIKTNDSCRIAHPALSPDNKRLYFSSDMKGTYGQSDIFYVDLFDNDSVSLPVNLGTSINTEGRDSYPFVSQDNQLFFASEGHPGMGGFDVFVIDLNATGSTPKNLAAPINSVDDDFAFVWKKDLYKAVLTSNRLGGKGDDDIYAFALPKPIQQVVPSPTEPAAIIAMGKETDAQTNTTGKLGSTETTEIAQQTLTIPATQPANSSVDQQLTPVPPVIEPVTPVVPAPTEPVAIVAMGKVTDSKTGAVLANSIVSVSDATGKVVATVSTDAEGNYNFPIVAGQSYQLAYMSNGYESAQQTLSIPATQNTNSSVDQQLTPVLPVIEPVTPVVPAPTEPITIGTDLAKVFAINPIYFDVNKAIIRPDAALELDKIVAILNENPTMEIELGSHTDCRSTALYNQSLSNRRAKASAAYIKARITNPKRIIGKGYGESQLLNNCLCEDSIHSICSEEEHQLNRRTEFKVVGYNGTKNSPSQPAVVVDNGTTITDNSMDKKPLKGTIKPNSKSESGISIVNKQKSPIEKQQKPVDVIVNPTYPQGFVVGADLTKLLQINMIYFDLDKYNIRPDAALELDKIVAVMKQYPNMKIELTSHTDCRMPADYNQRLSNNRARTSKSYLVAHGIKSTRIVGKGLGETQLAVNCPCEGEESSLCTEEQHQLNRRTEFIILSL
jgi:outer membrane protein OmpA-like peptidoglycan-associated protein/tetratricopeptide (TPR) repeat protein